MNSHKEDTRDTTQHILLVLFDKTISTQGLVSGCLQHFQVVGVFFLNFCLSVSFASFGFIYEYIVGCVAAGHAHFDLQKQFCTFFFRWHFSHTAETFHFPACDKHTQTENEHIANS